MIHGMQIIKLIDALFELDWMEFLGLPQVKLHNHFPEFFFNNALGTACLDGIFWFVIGETS